MTTSQMPVQSEPPAAQAVGKAPFEHLMRFAVTDGPNGIHCVSLTDDTILARKLRAEHDSKFWCSRQAGGCGGALTLAAGDVNRPYFRHRSGPASKACAFFHNASGAERSYEHLWFQRALSSWLMEQGLESTIEKHLGKDGRADLQVIVDGSEHTIEVQLSAMRVDVWKDRDARYRHAGARQVTWLFGPAAGAAQSVTTAQDKVAFQIGRCPPEPGTEPLASRLEVKIGAVTSYGQRWAPLEDCTFDATGLQHPFAALVQAEVDAEAARRRQEEEDARRRAQEEAEREAARRLALSEVDRRADLTRSPAPESFGPMLAIGQFARRTVATWRGWHPESADWSPAIGWGWSEHLTEPDQAAARFFAYLTQRIYLNGTEEMFSVPGVEDLAAVLEALECSGLISRSVRGGHRRWARTE